jgi:DNA repair exonuclease SbcCD nuclease subunit
MKLIAAADIHLDSPMKGLLKHDGAPVEELRGATRRALANLVDLAIDEQVAGVLLAGDLFDGNWSHYGTGVHFIKEIGRLREAQIPVVSIAGNHDADSKLSKALHMPDNFFSLSTKKPETRTFDDLGLAVHGQGYATPAVTEDLSAAYPEPLDDYLNVGLLHTCATGRPGHENYAPCALEALVARRYAYWGLGHVHAHEVLHTDPPVVFSGVLQGRGMREAGPKGAVLLEATTDGVTSFELRPLDVVRWHVLEIDASGTASLEDACELARKDLRMAVADADGRLLAVQIVIVGECDAHQQLFADPERLRAEMMAAAAEVGGDQVWVEQVKLGTRPSRPPAEGGSDAVGELLRELNELSSDPVALEALTEELKPLGQVLPTELREQWNPTDPGAVREVLAELSRTLPVALLEGEAP